LGLWFIFSSVADDGNPWTRKIAGLDSVWPEMTDLRIGLDCQDSRWQIWRWFTYQYTHMGVTHVIWSSLLSLLLGMPIERFYGTCKTVAMFNLGVFGGACCYFVTDVHHPALGMSGGCYSFIGMHHGTTLINWNWIRYRWAKLFFLVLLAIADILNSVLSVSHGDVTVSHSIHFGGYVTGVLISIGIGRNPVLKHWERKLQIAARILGCALVVFCLAWAMTWAPQTLLEQVRWCWTRQVRNATLFGDSAWHCVRCGSQVCIDKWSKQMVIDTVSTTACDRRGGWRVTEP